MECRTCHVVLTADNTYVSQNERWCKACRGADKNQRRRDGSEPFRSRRLKGRLCTEHPECATLNRIEVLARGNDTCGICLEPITGEWHMDHIMPLSRGGMHCYANLQPSHGACNLAKNDMTMEEYLAQQPRG